MPKINHSDNNFKTSFFATAGVIVGWEAEPYIKRGLACPILKYKNKMKKNIYGGSFKENALRAIEINNLKGKIKILDLNETTKDSVLRELNLNLDTHTNKPEKLINHILRRKSSIKSTFLRTLEGENAFFVPGKNTIVCNFDKFGSAAFHEIAHKLNAQSSNILLKTLAKIRNPLATLPAFISLIAMTTNPKDKNSLYKGADDYIKDNCGWLASVSLLPLTIEECIANIRGTKIAKQAGVTGKNLEKVIKGHKLSTLSYCTATITTGLAIYLANKLRDGISSLGKNNKG